MLNMNHRYIIMPIQKVVFAKSKDWDFSELFI